MTAIADDFNRADANPVGGNWTTISGGYADARIISNRLCSSLDIADSAVYWNASTPGANQFAQFTISAKANGNANWALFLRLDDAVGTYYMARHYTGAPWTRIYKSIATVLTQIAGDDTTAWAVSDVIYFQVNGSDLVLNRNGGTILSVSNGDIPATGAIGVRIAGYTGAAGSESIDDFAGGDLGSTNLMAQICL